MQSAVVHDARVLARPTPGTGVSTIRVGIIPVARFDRSVRSGVRACRINGFRERVRVNRVRMNRARLNMVCMNNVWRSARWPSTSS
jgi:hypothetical protein